MYDPIIKHLFRQVTTDDASKRSLCKLVPKRTGDFVSDYTVPVHHICPLCVLAALNEGRVNPLVLGR